MSVRLIKSVGLLSLVFAILLFCSGSRFGSNGGKSGWGQCPEGIECSGDNIGGVLLPNPVMLNSWVQGDPSVTNRLFRKLSGKVRSNRLSAPAVDWLVFNDKLVIADQSGAVSLYEGGELNNPLWAVSFNKFKVVPNFIRVSYSYEGNLVIVGMGSSAIYALNADSGKIVWQKELRAPLHERVLIHGNLVIFPTIDNYLYVVDSRKGQVLWGYQGDHVPVRLTGMYSVAVFDDKVFFASQSGSVYALDLNSGKLVWEIELSGEAAAPVVALVNPMILSQDRLLLSFNDGHSYAVDVKTGERLWAVYDDPKLADLVDLRAFSGNVTMVYSNGKVDFRELNGGEKFWSIDAAKIYSDTSVIGVMIFDNLFWLVGRDGHFLGFDLSAGKCMRSWQPSGAITKMPMIAFARMYLYNDPAVMIIG